MQNIMQNIVQNIMQNIMQNILQNIMQCIMPVLCIRIRMDPELLPGSGYGSGIKVPDLNLAKSGRAYN